MLGRSLAPLFACLFSALFLTHFCLWAVPSDFVFATISNLSFVAVALYLEVSNIFAVGAGAGASLGRLSDATLLITLMGASSFGFHRLPQLGQPLHTLDIFFGWILVAHAAYLTLVVSMLAISKSCLPNWVDVVGARSVRVLLSVTFIVVLVVMTILYDDVYGNQLTFYFVAGPIALVFGGICRFVLIFEDTGRVSCWAIVLGLFEMTVLIVMLLVAVFCQGGLIGRKIGESPEYQIYHGIWHFGLSSVLGVLYVRAGDVERLLQGEPVCVCSSTVLDAIGEFLLVTYGAMAVGFKESEQDIVIARDVLSGFNVVMGGYVIATIVVEVVKRYRPKSKQDEAPPTLTRLLSFQSGRLIPVTQSSAA